MKLGDTNSQVELPLVQSGTAVVTTDAFGSANINFPTPFADANRRVVVTNGDASASSQLYAFWVGIVAGGNNANAFTASCMFTLGNGAQPAANTFLRIDWIAIGARP